MYKCFFKRLIDFIIALCTLAFIWPILLLITIWLYFANKGAGAFFTQERPGKDGKIFRVIKFSIDELPQLINVLKGDMALIGPRPLLPEYLPLYSKEQARRHEVRPGITGWAQVNGRNFLPFSKRFELDVWYVDHCSFMLDLKIVCLSIHRVLFRKDISIGNHVAKDSDDLGFTKYIKQ